MKLIWNSRETREDKNASDVHPTRSSFKLVYAMSANAKAKLKKLYPRHSDSILKDVECDHEAIQLHDRQYPMR